MNLKKLTAGTVVTIPAGTDLLRLTAARYTVRLTIDSTPAYLRNLDGYVWVNGTLPDGSDRRGLVQAVALTPGVDYAASLTPGVP